MTSNDLISHILRSHLQLLIYRDPVSKEKKSMYGCPFCNEAFLWVGKIFSAHIQKHVLGKVVNRSFDFIERMLEVQNSDSEPDAKEVSVKMECMEDGEGDDYTEVINCADGDEGDYDAGQFTCQWELGRFGEDGQKRICGAFYDNRTEFVNHCRSHLEHDSGQQNYCSWSGCSRYSRGFGAQYKLGFKLQ